MSKNEKHDHDPFREMTETPEFKAGEDLGRSFGLYEANQSAINAYDAGEIDLWIEHHRPKTIEEWDEWEKELEARGITDIDTRWENKTRRG